MKIEVMTRADIVRCLSERAPSDPVIYAALKLLRADGCAACNATGHHHARTCTTCLGDGDPVF